MSAPPALYPIAGSYGKLYLGWVARRRPRPTLRLGCTFWVPILATTALKFKIVTIPKKVGCAAEVVTQSGDVSAPMLSCTRLADVLPPWQ